MSKGPNNTVGKAIETICLGLGSLALGIAFCPVLQIFPYYNLGTDIVHWIVCVFFSAVGIAAIIGGVVMVRDMGGVSIIRDILKPSTGLTRQTILQTEGWSVVALMLGLVLGYALIFHPDPTSSLVIHIIMWIMCCSL